MKERQEIIERLQQVEQWAHEAREDKDDYRKLIYKGMLEALEWVLEVPRIT